MKKANNYVILKNGAIYTKMTLTVKRIEKFVFMFTLLSFSISGSVFAYRLITELIAPSAGHILLTSYILSLLQCALGIFALFIPRLLAKKFRFHFPEHIKIPYFAFLYCAIFLGEVKNYYITIPLWDDILHGFSGVMAGLFAFMLTSVVLSRSNTENNAIPPAFIALFAFVFSVAIGAIWEIYEFSLDRIFELNMQKYRRDDGTALVGRDALFDTMKDVLIDTAGALIASIFGYTAIKTKRNWLKKYTLPPRKEQE